MRRADSAQTNRRDLRGGSLATPGVLIGVGMGGFVDGIVLHQILQWHQMLSTTAALGDETLRNIQINMIADGLFHVVTWVFVAVGVAMLWRVTRDRTWRRTWRTLLGWALLGWGAFKLLEGTINHHILQIHRVRPDAANPLVWDIGFLVFGAVLVAAGWLLQHSDRGEASAEAGPAPRPGLRTAEPLVLAHAFQQPRTRW